jgi:hypothetical protein
MLIFEYLKKKSLKGKIGTFYRDYEKLNFFKKMLWWIMFINWIPMVLSLVFFLGTTIAWNFVDCGTLFYISLGCVIVVFLPWLVSGFVNSIREYRDIIPKN